MVHTSNSDLCDHLGGRDRLPAAFPYCHTLLWLRYARNLTCVWGHRRLSIVCTFLRRVLADHYHSDRYYPAFMLHDTVPHCHNNQCPSATQARTTDCQFESTRSTAIPFPQSADVHPHDGQSLGLLSHHAARGFDSVHYIHLEDPTIILSEPDAGSHIRHRYCSKLFSQFLFTLFDIETISQ